MRTHTYVEHALREKGYRAARVPSRSARWGMVYDSANKQCAICDRWIGVGGWERHQTMHDRKGSHPWPS